MATSLLTIKSWFKRGKKPTQEQFSSTFDSFFHKLQLIPIASISGLQAALNNCASITQLNAIAAFVVAREVLNLGNRSTDYALSFDLKRFITVNFTTEINITLNSTNSVLLNEVIIEGTGIAPIFSSNFERTSGTWVDEDDVTNYVHFIYISSTRVIYSITQKFEGSVSSIVNFGNGSNGTWRDIVIDGVMYRQKNESGTWTTYQIWGE